jgi:predicted component of type VI protein secretion system
MPKLICKQTHIVLKDGKIDIDSKETRESFHEIIRELERQLRIQIHDEIAALKLTENRKQIIKNGIDNTALTVQDICAQVALGKVQK